MITLPQDIINRAIDALGSGQVIGDFTDGTVLAEWSRRNYVPTLRQLLRAAHWGFARKMATLELLGDATGNTLSPQGVPISMAVEPPWTYCYAWPTDAVQGRWLPWNNALPPNQAIPPQPPVPLVVGPSSPSPWIGMVPARFLCSTSDQFPITNGAPDWDKLPDIEDLEGVGLNSRRVVLTDVSSAQFVYTALVAEPDLWDDLFQEGLVATLAARVALTVLVDEKADMNVQAKQRQAALAVRAQQIAIAKEAVTQARVASANEAGFPQTVANTPDWLRARRAGGYSRGWGWGWGNDGPGYYWMSWSGMSFGDGNVF